MKLESNFKFNTTIVPFCYDEAEDAAAAAAEAAAAAAKAAAEGADKLFTQADLDKHIADRLAKKDQSMATTLQELNDLKASGASQTEQLDGLNATIERIRKESMTKEQIAREEATKATQLLESERDRYKGERDEWKGRFNTTAIQNSLLEEATLGGAVNPAQVLRELERNSELISELDSEGKETGRLVPVVNMATVDDAGKTVMLQLSPKDAIKRHKEDKVNWNLYKSNIKSGFGGSGGSDGSGDDANMSDEDYFARELKGSN